MIMHLSCLLEAEDIMGLQKISQVEMCVYLGQYGKFIYSKGKNNKLFQINYPLCNIRLRQLTISLKNLFNHIVLPDRRVIFTIHDQHFTKSFQS